MKLFIAPAANDLSFLFIALASYALFLILAITKRVGQGRQPLGCLHRLHFRVVAVYILATLGCFIFNRPAVTLITGCNWLVGLFVYFGIHYAIVANFFAIAQASVSTSVISILHARGGHATRAECMADYADGEGFAYIKKTRLARIQNLLGWVVVQDGRYRLTGTGRRIVQLTRVMLRSWGLSQIGKAPVT
ncbi:MAG: hypothetical protein WCG79_06320 [Verrucomicrobiota bacterium]